MKNLKNFFVGFILIILACPGCKNKKDETLTFTGVSTLEGNVNDEITLTGSALNTNLIVTFGDVEATEKSGGGKELKVKVPNGSTKGKIRITQGSNLYESAQDFTTRNYIQKLTNYAGNAYDYDIPLFYDGNKVWFKKDIAQNGGTRVSSNPTTYRDFAYVTWQQATNICPQGWRLPTKADFEELARASVLTSFQSYDLLINPNEANLQLNGYLDFSAPQLWHDGNNGYYWTATENNILNNEAFVLTISRVNITTPFYFAYSNKGTGVCVRCVKNLP